MPIVQSRRRFLTNLAFTGAFGLGGASVASLGGGRKSFRRGATVRSHHDPLWKRPRDLYRPASF